MKTLTQKIISQDLQSLFCLVFSSTFVGITTEKPNSSMTRDSSLKQKQKMEIIFSPSNKRDSCLTKWTWFRFFFPYSTSICVFSSFLVSYYSYYGESCMTKANFENSEKEARRNKLLRLIEQRLPTVIQIIRLPKASMLIFTQTLNLPQRH